MGGAIISNPEDSMCRPIRFLLHDQVHQFVVGFYAGSSLADPEELGSVNVPSGNIGQGPLSFVFELHASWVMRDGAGADGLSVASLNTGLFVGTDHVVIWPQRNTIEESIIQVQDSSSLFSEKRVARRKLAVMHPRLYGVTVEPTPNRGNANGYHNASHHCLPGDVGVTETGKGKPQCAGEFTGQSLNLYNALRGKMSAVCRTSVGPPDRPVVHNRNACAIS